MATIITISKIVDEDFTTEFFFSTDHCQPDLSSEWVPTTHYNTNKETVKVLFYNDAKEIPNPNPVYQA